MKTSLRTVLLLALLLAPSGAPAQEEPASIYGETIDVRVVNVEVVVTGRDGERVTDLKPSDFRLKVDGKVVPVEYFSEVREEQAVAPPAAAGAPETPAGGADPGEAVGTNYLVFVDDVFAIGLHRNEVFAGLKVDLANLKYETKLKLQGKATRLVLAVYDPVSGKIATAQTAVPAASGS